MAEIRVPTLGESVTEATIGKWFKKPGEAVAVDEPLVELETDKVTIEVPAPAAGVLVRDRGEGRRDRRGRRAARPDQGRRRRARRPARARPRRPAGRTRRPRPPRRSTRRRGARAARAAKADAQPASSDMPVAPSVRRLAAETGVDPAAVAGSGKDGRVTKGDMMAAIERAASAPTPVAAARRRGAGARAVAGRRRLARRARAR